ncbi:MAG: carboxypeptidase-like regulatory domain-containing protein [Planctomycetota bacterium]
MGPRKLPALVAAVALALLGTVGWFLLRSSDDGSGREPADRAPATPASAAGGEEALVAGADLAPTEGASAGREARQLSPTEGGAQSAPAKPEWQQEGEQWLEGRIAFPEGTPEDERVLVVAVEAEMKAPAFYQGPGEEAWKATPSFQEGLVSLAEVDEDGAFRIALPAGKRFAHLGVAGRYLFARGTVAVDLPAAEPVVLGAELGAWVQGVLVPPRGTSGVDADLSGTEVGLGPDLSAGFNPEAIQEEAWGQGDECDADGRFEFRGINPRLPRAVFALPEHFAAPLVTGIELKPGERSEVEVALAPGATLRGRVVDAGGDPIGRASIEVRLRTIIGQAYGAVREGESDADGVFELRAVCAGPLSMRVAAEGYRKLRHDVAQEAFDGDTIEGLELVLDRGSALAGSTVFPGGDPAPGTLVTVTIPASPFGGLEGSQAQRVASGKSAGDGGFEIFGLREIAYDVTAAVEVESGERAGSWSARRKGAVAGGDPLELTLARILPLRGRVVDADGAPITQFRIHGAQGADAMFGVGAEYRTWPFEDEDGRFAIEDLEPGTWELSASADGFSASETRPFEAPVPEGAEELVFALAPSASIEGLVVDPYGAPAPGAKVSLELELAAMMRAMSTGGIPEVRCDAEGRFRMEDLDAGSLNLVASLDGFARSEAVPCEVEPGALLDEVVLQLRIGGTLTGELYDDVGEPDPGTMVIAQKLPGYGMRHLITTDSEGLFRVEHIEPGNWQVLASGDFMTADPERGNEQAMADFLGNMKMEFVEIVDGEESHVVLGAPGEEPIKFYGRVVHAGEPVEGMLVMVMPGDATSIGEMKMTPTSGDGTFEFLLDGSGGYQVTVQSGADLGQQNNVEYTETIPSGASEHEFEIELPLGRISGRVLGPDREPLAGARVTLNVDGPVAFGSFLGNRFVDTVTDGEGRYDIPYLRPGTYSLGAGGTAMGGVLGGDSPGGRIVRDGLKLSEGEWLDSIDFQLRAPGVLKGLVLGENGAPVPEASIFVRDGAGRLLEHFTMVATDAAGRFAYEGVAPGTYTFSARNAAGASVDSEAIVIPEAGAGEGQVVLVTGSVLVVRVVDQSGGDVESRLSVRDSQGRELSTMRSVVELMTLLEGNTGEPVHRIGPVAPGSYELIATTDDGRKGRKRVNVTGQPERKVKLRVR